MNIRIRLFGLQSGIVHSDEFLQKSIQSFRAPENNELEIEQEISINSSTQEFSELLMHVWEKFRTPDDKIPVFKEKEFALFLNNILAE